MDNKQIEEMAEIIRNHCGNCDFEEDNTHECGTKCKMEALYNAGYRKERQGKWIRSGMNTPKCSLCHQYSYDFGNYCPNCGARMMKGE